MKKLLLILTTVVLIGMFLQANAIALSIGDANYLGLINDGIPANPALEVDYINDLITLAAGAGDTDIGTETYNRLNSTLAGPFSPAVLAGAKKDEISPFYPFDATGYEYIIGKYDASQAGSLVWYFAGGFSGNLSQLPATLNNQGLSHISAYNSNSIGNPVPEPATMILFAAGLIGLAGFGRKKFMKS